MDEAKNFLNVGTNFSLDEKSIRTFSLWTGAVVFGAILFNWALNKFL